MRRRKMMVAAVMDQDNNMRTHGGSDLAALSERNEVLVGELQGKVTQLRMQVFQLANRAATLREEVARAEMEAEASRSKQPGSAEDRTWWRKW